MKIREVTSEEHARLEKYFPAAAGVDCIIVTGRKEYFGVTSVGGEFAGANFLRRYDDGQLSAKNEKFGCQNSNRIELFPPNSYSFERGDGLGLASESHAQLEYKV